jgi:hypothetical protein
MSVSNTATAMGGHAVKRMLKNVITQSSYNDW